MTTFYVLGMVSGVHFTITLYYPHEVLLASSPLALYFIFRVAHCGLALHLLQLFKVAEQLFLRLFFVQLLVIPMLVNDELGRIHDIVLVERLGH